MLYSIRQGAEAASKAAAQIAEDVGGYYDARGMMDCGNGIALEVPEIASVDEMGDMYITIEVVTGAAFGFEGHTPMILKDRNGQDVTHLLVNDEGLVDADWFIPQIDTTLETIALEIVPDDDSEDDI